MIAIPRSIHSLRKLTRNHPDKSKLFDVLETAWDDSNDMAAALMFGSLLESTLQQLILTKLTASAREREDKLFGARAPLREFSAKIEIGYALGLYGPLTYSDLDVVRDVRNAFAHTRQPIDFNTLEVANVCRRIKFPKRAQEHGADITDLALESPFKSSAMILTLLFDGIANNSRFYEASSTLESPTIVSLLEAMKD